MVRRTVAPADADWRLAADVGSLVFCNPFTPRRVELERRVVGRLAARPVWARTAGEPDEDPVSIAIRKRAEPLTLRLRDAIATGHVDLDETRRRVYEELVVYTLYYRVEAELRRAVVDPRERDFACFCDLERDLERLAAPAGARLVAVAPAHLFALFFQIRRAFHFTYHDILGASAAAARLRASVWESIFTHDLRRYSDSLHGRMHELTTLITGPSGTGKELVAAAIGRSSYIPFDPARRRFEGAVEDSFHPLALSALSRALIESELFGHQKGAFTGAVAERRGYLEDRASWQTVFLDEIGELEGDVQVKLLRVLQSRTFQRIGDTRPLRFGGKVVAATHRDLAREIAEGRFREDLYYRLCSDLVATPSLAEQLQGDEGELRSFVALLLGRILGRDDPALADEVTAALDRDLGRRYRWPGNVRELEQAVRNVLVRGHYQPATGASPPRGPLEGLTERMTRLELTADDVLDAYCTWAYGETGSYETAAERLGLDRRTLRRRVRPARSRRR